MSLSVPSDTTNTPPVLSLRLLGTFSLKVRDKAAPPLSRSSRALLALLALRNNSRGLERDFASALLWPGSDDNAARYNLRRTLTEVRTALGPEADRLDASTTLPRTLRLDLSGDTYCDVAAFDALIRRGDEAALIAAVRIYSESGALLEGERSDWILAEREKRRLAYLEARERLAGICRARGDMAAAIAHLRGILLEEPARETAVRDLMRLLQESGQNASANAVYGNLRTRLRETATNPDAETTALYRQIWAESRRSSVANPKVGGTPASPYSGLGAGTTRSLPQPFTVVIGRSRDHNEIAALLTGDKGQMPSRLITLAGTGGVGKTTLAVDVARAVLSAYGEGVYFVDLGPLNDATQILPLVARTLGLPEEARDQIALHIVEKLRSGRRLLLLDNAEHLIADIAQLARTLLRDCPALTILATSREPLRVPGEVVWRVPGLAQADAVHLFLTRTAEANAGYPPRAAQKDAVLKIVTRLDGIPLAIEMAAARTRVLSVKQIAEKLEDVFRLLNVPGGDLLPRHQTLRATLDWSYNLLGTADRTLLSRLSIFAGGWTLEAAEAVCTIDDAFPDGEVLDLMIALVEQSLVVYEENPEGEGRYRFLETTRAYAGEKLTGIERSRLHTALLSYLLRLAETAKTYFYAPQESEWLDRLEKEWPNIQVALTPPAESDASNDRAETPFALRLASTLQRFWYRRGYMAEGRHFLSVALGRNPASKNSETRAAALNTRGAIANIQQDTAAALADLEESRAIRRQLGDRRGEAVVLRNLGTTRAYAGDLTAAAAALAECIILYREAGEEQRAADNERLLHEINAARGLNTSDLTDVYRSGLDAAIQQGDRFSEVRYSLALNSALYGVGSFDEAWKHLRRALSIAFADGDGRMIAAGLERAAEVILAQGDATGIPLLYSAAERLRNETGTPYPITNQSIYDENRKNSRAALGDAVFDALWERGQSMKLEQAVAYVLEGGKP